MWLQPDTAPLNNQIHSLACVRPTGVDLEVKDFCCSLVEPKLDHASHATPLLPLGPHRCLLVKPHAGPVVGAHEQFQLESKFVFTQSPSVTSSWSSSLTPTWVQDQPWECALEVPSPWLCLGH